MNLKPRRLSAVFLCLLTALSLLLCSCGRDRLAWSGGETGEFYSADGSHQKSGLNESSPGSSDAGKAGQAQFDAFCDEIFRDELSAASTLDLHYTLVSPEAYGIDKSETALGSYSLNDMMAGTQEAKQLREQLLQFDRSVLSSAQKQTYDALLNTLETTLLREGMELYEQPLAPTIGIQAQLPILLAEYSFRSLQDVEDYLALLSQIDVYYNQILAFENQKADAGLAPSDASIDEILASCEGYRINPEDNFLTETFHSRLMTLPDLTEEQKADFHARHTAAIREHFLPAYETLIAGMNALKGRGIQDGGLCNLKDGKRYYEYLLKSGTGTSYTVEELKQALARRIDTDLTTISRLFEENPALDVQNASFTLSDPQQILEDLKRQMKQEFPAMAECGYEIRYVPSYLEAALSPAFYLTAPLDDVNHNVIYINNAYSDSTDGLYTTLAHEGFPGHLYQTVYWRTHAPSPLSALLSCSGANEGWATYVENYACTLDNGLPKEVGIYRAALRSISLCVHGLLDIGVNYDGWSREEAGRFITSYFRVDEESAARLWQVMIDNPTNYLEYCNGYVELMEMREQAENTLKGRFSPMEFHRFLLDMGPVPFSVMRPWFSDWLQKQNTH